MRGSSAAVVLAALLLLAVPMAIPEAEAYNDCIVTFDYSPTGHAQIVGWVGYPLPPENIQWLVDMGTWHHEDGTPWDPGEIVSGSCTIYIDDPQPIPVPPSPAPVEPEQEKGRENLSGTAIAGIWAGAASIILVAVLVLFRKK